MVGVDINRLLDIGIALSAEKDANKLFETILDAAMDISNCDGGTLYILKDDALWFTLLITKSSGFRQGFDGAPINLPPVSLAGSNDCSRAALTKTPINVPDVYTSTLNDYSGTKEYDKLNNYRTVSMLSVPMDNDRGDVIGVLQLINAKDENDHIVPFAKECERIIFSLASQAAICLTNRNYAAEVSELLDSFVRVMSTAIDARSPYNANHTKNMAKYAQRFIQWMNENSDDVFNGERERQLLMSVWLHDIGKLVVPLEIMDKESRLGAKITDILNRYVIFEMQNRIDMLSGVIDIETYESRINEIENARDLVQNANMAGFLSDEMLDKLKELGVKSVSTTNADIPYLMHDELECLSVRKGTLTDNERSMMESHVKITRKMLSEVAFPKHFRFVPDWASAHHEHLNGRGYPDGISADAIPEEARILTILDVYDALTARDRPYKKAMTASKAFDILDDMAREGQIDESLLRLFRESEAWKEQSDAEG